jgi:SAM-dependent methyltransferase
VKRNRQESAPEVLELNREFYSALYRRRGAWRHRLRTWLSFDQQAKSRENHAILKPVLARLQASGRTTRVLDFGSGWGAFLLAMPPGAFELYCYDLVPAAVESLCAAMRSKGRSVEAVTLDERGTLSPGGFDLVVCSHVLEHVESDAELMSRLVNSLRPGGYFLVNVPINESWDDPRHLRSYTSEAVRGLVRTAGLRIVATAEADRWTGFLLGLELTRGPRSPARLALRALRALLAIAPRLAIRSERWFLGRYPPVQSLVLGEK